ncbi:O-antigen ligase family protein [Pseudoduganella sp. GCM10020061]|uniref:O-antigen ligase family protein n=1 Tax=Pseudoduganella sp. GCM10020061 TaxID=3317345 RepID=UPI00363FDD7D
MDNKAIQKSDAKQLIAGFLVFLFPFLSLILKSGVSIASFPFLLAALAWWRPARDAFVQAWPQVRWVVLAFGAWFLYNLALFVLDGRELSDVENPLRMFACFSAMLVVLAVRPSHRIFLAGVSAGAVAGAAYVAYQRLELGMDRPGGQLNPITFGDLSLALALVAIAAATELRSRRHAAVLVIGAVAGVAGSLLTGTRGGWVALAVAVCVFLRYSVLVRNRLVIALTSAAVLMLAGAYLVPETGVRARIEEGLFDVREYRAGGEINTRVGTRLELWKAATIMIGERPWFGRQVDATRERIATLAGEGRVDPAIVPLPHLQNDALQVMATTGVTGLLVWLTILLAPLVFFARQLRASYRSNRQRFALALAGLVVVTSYASFGLTEVIFWSVGGSLFYSLMIFLLMGFSLNSKDHDEI